MFTSSRELVMIDAHCLLVGLEVGASRVIEKSGPDDVVCAMAGSGKDEETRTNAITPRSAPFAEPLSVEERIFEPNFRPLGYLRIVTISCHFSVMKTD